MKRNQLYSMVAALACMAAVGCDTTTTDPTSQPSAIEDHGKTPMPIPMSCQTFASILHCPIGGASLTLNPSDLTVSSLGSGGSDGVSSSFVAADEWRQTAAVQFSTSGGGVLTYTGYTGGTVNAALNITQSITTPSLLLNPLFNATTGGSTFTVEVFNGSTSQGSQTGASGGAQARIQLPAGFTRPLIIEPVWNQLVSGQCQFTAILPSATTMTLPNGTSLTGDRVVFTEEINPGGHYPYTGATSMDVQSNVSSYVITAESIIPH